MRTCTAIKIRLSSSAFDDVLMTTIINDDYPRSYHLMWCQLSGLYPASTLFPAACTQHIVFNIIDCKVRCISNPLINSYLFPTNSNHINGYLL